MPGLDLISSAIYGTQRVAYLFEELDPSNSKFRRVPAAVAAKVAANPSTVGSGIFVFQFWPGQVQDGYDVEYATKVIPGGSHPLYQWVAGSGRVISFEAIFTAEVEDSTPTVGITPLTPSGRYTVNVAGAISALKSYQLPDYKQKPGTVIPPPRLRLVFPNSRLGGQQDDVLCFLKSAKITRESFFPSGTVRIATVALEFIETVQVPSTATGVGANQSSINFIDRSSFQSPRADPYSFGGVA